MLTCDNLVVLSNSLHKSVILDRLVIEVFNVWDWRVIWVDAESLPKKQTAMNVHQIKHRIFWRDNFVT